MAIMKKEDADQLASALAERKRAVRENLALIRDKLQRTQAQLSPANFVREHALPLCGVALILGPSLAIAARRSPTWRNPRFVPHLPPPASKRPSGRSEEDEPATNFISMRGGREPWNIGISMLR
jgi:hypothetical protein